MYVYVCAWVSNPFIAWKFTNIWIRHDLYIHSPVNGHLGYFHLEAIVNEASKNILVHVLRDLYSDPLVSMRGLAPGLYTDTKICVCSSPIVTPPYMWVPHPWIQPAKDHVLKFTMHSWLNPPMWNPQIQRADCIYWKKSAYKWICTIQTCVVQGSTIFISISKYLGLESQGDRIGVCLIFIKNTLKFFKVVVQFTLQPAICKHSVVLYPQQ